MTQTRYDPDRKPGVQIGVLAWMLVAALVAATIAGAWFALYDLDAAGPPSPPTNLRIVPTK